jgi:hypothetical protein
MSTTQFGLGQHNRNLKPRVYVQFNAKDGKLYTKEKNPETGEAIKTAHDTVAGNLMDLTIKEDSYDGEQFYKLEVHLDGGNARYVVTFTAHTTQALELMGRMNNANVHEPMLIGGYTIAAGEPMLDGTLRAKDLVGVTLRQGQDMSTKIDPNYGPTFGATKPGPVKLLDDDGRVVKIKGEEQIDKKASDEARSAVTGGLITTVLARLKAGPQESDGISTDEAMDAAQAADRNAMRARAA